MIFETEACVGCRTCEMACSYHHMGAFKPSISSIQIVETPENLGFTVSLCAKDGGTSKPCDLCNGLDEPLCVKYCSPLMKEELKEILRKYEAAGIKAE